MANRISKIYDLIFLQFTLAGVIAIIAGVISGWPSLKSAFLGGGAWIIPSLFFTWKLHKTKEIFDTGRMLRHFFLNEVIKLLLCFAIIILILLIFTIKPLSFLVGFGIAVAASVLMPFVSELKNDKSTNS